VEKNYLGAFKETFGGIVWEGHLYEATINGTPQLKEADKIRKHYP
jgi:hypothetical protein